MIVPTMRDLPMPASPAMSRHCPCPAAASPVLRATRASTSSRPTTTGLRSVRVDPTAPSLWRTPVVSIGRTTDAPGPPLELRRGGDGHVPGEVRGPRQGAGEDHVE